MAYTIQRIWVLKGKFENGLTYTHEFNVYPTDQEITDSIQHRRTYTDDGYQPLGTVIVKVQEVMKVIEESKAVSLEDWLFSSASTPEPTDLPKPEDYLPPKSDPAWDDLPF